MTDKQRDELLLSMNAKVDAIYSSFGLVLGVLSDDMSLELRSKLEAQMRESDAELKARLDEIKEALK